jgi:hypothetical protein
LPNIENQIGFYSLVVPHGELIFNKPAMDENVV